MEKSLALVVGHYCHDTLLLSDQTRSETLGGSAAYISAVWSSLGFPFQVVSKVGEDFKYLSRVAQPAQVVTGTKTTHFIGDFTRGERVESLLSFCEPIYPRDIPEHGQLEVGVAAGLFGEVLPETLLKLASHSKWVLCDLQGLIRTADSNGRVVLQSLQNTAYFRDLEKISFLKASRKEAECMNIDEVRKRSRILITEGKEGCTLYDSDRVTHVPAFVVEEIDPTGAGDCFLAGFAAGLLEALPIERAIEKGCYFGSLAVQQIGIPNIKL